MPGPAVKGGPQHEWTGWKPTSSTGSLASLGNAVSSPAPAPAPAPATTLGTESSSSAVASRSSQSRNICAWLSSWCCCNSNGDQSAYQAAPE